MYKVHISLFTNRTTFFGIYASNTDEKRDKKKEFCSKVQELLYDIATSWEIFILEDINARIRREMESKVVKLFGENLVDNNRKSLIDLCNNNSLKAFNGFFKHK